MAAKFIGVVKSNQKSYNFMDSEQIIKCSGNVEKSRIITKEINK